MKSDQIPYGSLIAVWGEASDGTPAKKNWTFDDDVAAVAEARTTALAAAETATAASLTVAMPTWAALADRAVDYLGQRAVVYGDAGTHADPVTAATVANSGIFSGTATGWRWLAPTGTDLAPAADAAVMSMSGAGYVSAYQLSLRTASADQARAMADNAFWMTALRTGQAMDARFGAMKTQAIASEYGYVLGWIDKVGRLLGGFKKSGRLAVKLDDTAYVPPAALDAGVQARLIPAGTTGAQVLTRINPAAMAWREFDPASGYIYGITDTKGRIVLGITPEGHLRARIANGATVPVAALDPAMVARINPAGITWKAVSPESGYVFAAVDTNNRILFGVTTDGRFKARLADGVGVSTSEIAPLVASALASMNLFPSSAIACWGDSMTAGAGGGGTTYTGVLASALGATVVNLGIGGQTSTQIAARQGGVDIACTVSGDMIPASGGVSVTSRSVNPLFNSGNFGGSMTGTLAGVPGTISATTATVDGDSLWTFTRSSPGSAVACPPGTKFIPDTAGLHEAKTVIIWAGRNNFGALTTVRDDILAMVKRLTPLNKRVLVLGICNGKYAGEESGGSGYINMMKLNQELARLFGDQFVDIRRYMIDFGLSDAGITATSQDLTDISQDRIPSSLLADNLHWTGPGYTVGGNLIARVVRAKGWA